MGNAPAAGTGHSNDEFPNGESILKAFAEVVSEAGVKRSIRCRVSSPADAVIAIYGEDPRAEFQGDREQLDFEPTGFDVNLLAEYRQKTSQ